MAIFPQIYTTVFKPVIALFMHFTFNSNKRPDAGMVASFTF